MPRWKHIDHEHKTENDRERRRETYSDEEEEALSVDANNRLLRRTAVSDCLGPPAVIFIIVICHYIGD